MFRREIIYGWENDPRRFLPGASPPPALRPPLLGTGVGGARGADRIRRSDAGGSFALRRMIDFGFSKDSGGTIDAYFLAMGVVVLVIALAAATRYYLVATLGERVVADLRRDVFAHLTGLDAAFYDRARIGELVSRLTADTTQIKSAFGSSASIALRNLFMFVGSTALMVYTSPKLSALVLVAIPVIAAPLIASGRVVRGRSRHAQDTLAEATAFATESLGAVRTMQAFGAEKASKARFAARRRQRL